MTTRHPVRILCLPGAFATFTTGAALSQTAAPAPTPAARPAPRIAPTPGPAVAFNTIPPTKRDLVVFLRAL